MIVTVSFGDQSLPIVSNSLSIFFKSEIKMYNVIDSNTVLATVRLLVN